MTLRLVSVDPSVVNAPGYLVAGNVYQVGRSKRCAFVLNDQSVSRTHAEVAVEPDAVRVRDLKSMNGTFVDGKSIQEAIIKPGQSVRFGRVHFVLRSDQHVLSVSEDFSDLSTHRATGSNSTNELPALALLSEGQRQVLDQLLTGLQEKEVAARIGISPHTVHNHVKEIYKKLEVTSRAALLALFVSDVKKPRQVGG